MTTKILNGKVLLGVFSVVLLITAMIPIVLSVAGGQGKAKGNSCMAQCLKEQIANWYDLSNERVQACRYECGTGIGEGVCTLALDGCCVPDTEDPDCGEGICVTITVLWADDGPAEGFAVSIIPPGGYGDTGGYVDTTESDGIVEIPCNKIDSGITYTAVALNVDACGGGGTMGTAPFTKDDAAVTVTVTCNGN